MFVNLTTNTNGEATTTLPAGQYKFLVKATGYLDRKFGSQVNPIVLSGGSHYLDLTEILILGGDFNQDVVAQGLVVRINHAGDF